MEYDEQDIEEVWATDPLPSGSYRNQMTLEDNPMEGSSVLNTNVPYASRDTMGFRRYRYSTYIHTYIHLTRFQKMDPNHTFVFSIISHYNLNNILYFTTFHNVV